MPNPSSANAVKHGLSSLRHVPRGQEELLLAIEQELVESRGPETPEQLEIVKELSFAMWQKGQHDQSWLEHAVITPVDTDKLYDQKTAAAFAKLNEQWLANPPGHAEAMANCLAGAKHFLRIWQTFLQCLADGSQEPSLQMTCDAIRSLGISTSPQMIYGDGEWLLVQSLALKPKPDKIIMEWHINEKSASSEDAIARAKTLRESIANAGDARTALRKRAAEEVARWQKQVEIQAEADEYARLQFQELNRHRVQLDPEHEAFLLRMHRYRVFTENRVKDLNRRLANNKAELARKKRSEEAKEERRLNRELQAARQSQMQADQAAKKQAVTEKAKKLGRVLSGQSHLDNTLYSMPRNWKEHPEDLTRVRPSPELFRFWSDLDLDLDLERAPELIDFLMSQPEIDQRWVQQISDSLEHEVRHRDLKLAKSA